jgi:cyclase
MFYGASPLIFHRAKELRNQLTHAERILWGYLKNKPSGYKFRQQHPIGIFIADFYCHKLKLIIEVDGLVHGREEVRASDQERQKILEQEGIKVIRFTNEEVLKNVEGIIQRITSQPHLPNGE